jgi:hypothetical protein
MIISSGVSECGDRIRRTGASVMMTETTECREINEEELPLVTGGAVPNPAILFREHVEKTAEEFHQFMIVWSITPWVG